MPCLARFGGPLPRPIENPHAFLGSGPDIDTSHAPSPLQSPCTVATTGTSSETDTTQPRLFHTPHMHTRTTHTHHTLASGHALPLSPDLTLDLSRPVPSGHHLAPHQLASHPREARLACDQASTRGGPVSLRPHPTPKADLSEALQVVPRKGKTW